MELDTARPRFTKPLAALDVDALVVCLTVSPSLGLPPSKLVVRQKCCFSRVFAPECTSA